MIPVPDVLTAEQSTTLRNWGVKAPEHVPGKRPHDGRFVKVEAPEGWEVVRHAHYMYRALVDNRGLRRALFFCKPEAYDQRTEVNEVSTAVRANIRPAPRGEYIALVVLGSRYILWEGAAPVGYDEVYKQAFDVMRERWPNFADYTAYWDLPTDGLATFVEQA